MKKTYRKILHKAPILKYILDSLIKSFIIAAIAAGVIYGILFVTGIYPRLESILDLKYNSPFVLGPIFVCIAVAALSFLIGFLLYFHKYKRKKIKTRFYEAISEITKNPVK